LNTTTDSVKRAGFKFPVVELMLLLVAIFWGTSYGLTKLALLQTSVLIFILIRFSITFFCMLPAVIQDFRRGLNKDWSTAIPSGLILSAIFFCEVYGVSQTTASNAAFLISLSVILTAFAEIIINKGKISKWLWGMSCCSVTGVLLLTGKSDSVFSFNSGDSFILLAALLRALMVTLTRRFSLGRSITTSTLTALQSLVVAFIAMISAAIYLPKAQFFLPMSSEFWFIVAYLVVFCTLFAFYVQNYAVRRTSPTRVSLLMGSEPLFGAIFAAVWLQENLIFTQVLGGSLILLSVIITSTRSTS
jgi:drug/metabolite transporter (DMT)-like permease